jgi:hypothetical protein
MTDAAICKLQDVKLLQVATRNAIMPAPWIST